jgi:hypothetical protein
MSEHKGLLWAKGLVYDYELESFEVASSPDEIVLLKTAVMCLNLAKEAIEMAGVTRNYFTENNSLYLNLIKVIRNSIEDRI